MTNRTSGEGSPASVRSRAHRSSRAAGARRAGRRALAFPHTLLGATGRRPSPTEPRTLPCTSDESHLVARAWRIREVHLRAGNHMCGLCLTAWPCAQRVWADAALNATLDAAG
jgi:hypothetical protein